MSLSSIHPPRVAVVTGANGFVGSHLVEHLLAQGCQVRCIVRKTSNLQWIQHLPVQLIYCGLDNVSALTDAFDGATHIYHIAGVVKSDTPEGFYNGNVTPTLHVLEAALPHRQHIQRIVITSSLAATGPSTPAHPVHESTPPNPVNNYGRSKQQQEAAIQPFHAQLPITVIRPPAVFGERDTEVLMLFQSIAKGWLPLLGASNKEFSMVYVHNLVAGIWQASLSPAAIGRTYFIAYPQPYTMQQIGSILAQHMGRTLRTFVVPHALIRLAARVLTWWGTRTRTIPALNNEQADQLCQPSWACSTHEAEHDFNFLNPVPIEDALANTLQWYRQQGWM